MIWDSFFDDDISNPKQTYTIWKKPTDNTNLASVDHKDLIFEGHLMKYDKKVNSHKEHYFILTKDKLYYKKVV